MFLQAGRHAHGSAHKFPHMVDVRCTLRYTMRAVHKRSKLGTLATSCTKTVQVRQNRVALPWLSHRSLSSKVAAPTDRIEAWRARRHRAVAMSGHVPRAQLGRSETSLAWVSARSMSTQELTTITAARLEQLLEAEITSLALRKTRPLTLQSMLDATGDADEMARLLHDELPVRFAQRIMMLESLPDWRNHKPIVHVRELYVTSFKQLRQADPSQPANFQEQLYHIKKRHSQTNLLVGGFKEYTQVDELGEAQVNKWLDRFFVLRVSTNMLISHYLQIARPGSRPEYDGSINPYQSSINPLCKPYEIAKHAKEIIQRMCKNRYGCSPEIEIKDVGSRPFPFVPRYLFYILSELLKNSVRATVEQHAYNWKLGKMLDENECKDMPPVLVIVSGDENVSSIRIRDEGGGIPLRSLDHVWSYLYSTAEPVDCPITRASVDAPTDIRRLDDPRRGTFDLPDTLMDRCRDSEEVQSMILHSPLAGLGCGLPLSRLYARYLGGKVELQTLPRYGTDVFVYLNRLGTFSENLPKL